jgi:hypothetical protein
VGPRRQNDGRLISYSILGDIEDFEEMELTIDGVHDSGTIIEEAVSFIIKE